MKKATFLIPVFIIFSMVCKANVTDICFSPKEPCDQRLINFIQSAQTSIDMSIYNITIQELADALVQAQEKGIQVRLVVDAKESTWKTSKVPLLIQAKIPLKYGDACLTSSLMHNKFTIIDGEKLQTGSFNYTVAATKYNTENQIYLDDINAVKIYLNEFEKLWTNGLNDTSACVERPTN